MEGAFDVVILEMATRTIRNERNGVDLVTARAFCRGYNKDEAKEPAGLWAAVVPRSTTTTPTIERRQSAALAK